MGAVNWWRASAGGSSADGAWECSSDAVSGAEGMMEVEGAMAAVVLVGAAVVVVGRVGVTEVVGGAEEAMVSDTRLLRWRRGHRK